MSVGLHENVVCVQISESTFAVTHLEALQWEGRTWVGSDNTANQVQHTNRVEYTTVYIGNRLLSRADPWVFLCLFIEKKVRFSP